MFQPSDIPKQCIEKWCSLKYTPSVVMYMNELETFHETWRLYKKAKSGLALRRMKKELKGIIKRFFETKNVK